MPISEKQKEYIKAWKSRNKDKVALHNKKQREKLTEDQKEKYKKQNIDYNRKRILLKKYNGEIEVKYFITKDEDEKINNIKSKFDLKNRTAVFKFLLKKFELETGLQDFWVKNGGSLGRGWKMRAAQALGVNPRMVHHWIAGTRPLPKNIEQRIRLALGETQ